MTMRKTIEVISRLAADGAINEYAIAGAVAALSYIQPFLTEDLDVLVSVSEFDQGPSGLILQSGIESRLATLGYTERSGVGVIVEGWPVQFIPVGSPLDEAALRQATDIDLDGFTARFLRPEYLVAKAVSLGRLKDLARVEAFLDQDAVDLAALRLVLTEFDLLGAWKSFCLKAGRVDPLNVS